MNLGDVGIQSLAVYGDSDGGVSYYLDGVEITQAEYDRITQAMGQVDAAHRELRKVVEELWGQEMETENDHD